MAKKNINLAEEAKDSAGTTEVEKITFEDLLEICPNDKTLKKLKKTDDDAAKLIDLLYVFANGDLRDMRQKFNALDEFSKKLKAYLLQELEDAGLESAGGKVGQISINEKKIATVEDWDKFYKYIKRTDGFDMLNRAINQKAIAERLDAKKKVGGIDTFDKKTLSLTKA